jgi:hypothetical protein
VELFADSSVNFELKGEDKMEYLNHLISAAQSILDNGFDAQAFTGWKELAFPGLLGLLGPLHHYTQMFKRVTAEQGSLSLLAGTGILIAAKEEMLKNCEQRFAKQR